MLGPAAAAVVVLAFSAIPTQTYRTFTILDVPGSVAQYGTSPQGVDGASIVGVYHGTDGRSHGFLYDGSSWTTLDFPDAVETSAYGISGNRITGSYVDSSFQTHGFVYDGSTWESLDVPGGERTTPFGIDGDTIVGYYMHPNSHGAAARGFVYDGSTYAMLHNPEAAFTFAMAIDGDRVLAHCVTDGGSDYNAVYDGATWRNLPLPDSTAYGISGNRIVASDLTNSYLLEGADLTLLNVPGAYATIVTGISDTTIVGRYHSAGAVHGFIATIPEPMSIALLSLGGLLIGWRRL